MQVKKFEAKTMKDALELVKRHLGPEAIILSARDNSRGFGIAGQRSVEVTAAISEDTLRRKSIAESKLTQALKEKYENVPAWQQRSFIDRATLRPPPEKPPTKPLRYADIVDDVHDEPISQIGIAEERVKTAAQRAFQALNDAAVVPPPVVTPARPAATPAGTEVRELQAEILQLRKIIDGFKKVPQTFVNMHPGAEHGLNYELSAPYQKLLRAGISIENAVEILRQAQNILPKEQQSRGAFVDAWVAKHIMDQIQIAALRTSSRIQAFVGSAGQGKTSALVKLAGHMVICEKRKIAIATTDTEKVGAAEQLRIYAQILNVPFVVIRNSADWAAVKSRLGQVEHILVDFPGMNLKSIHEIDFIRNLLPPSENSMTVHYVQSVLSNDESAMEIASRYKMIGFDDVIFTGLDEAAQHGLIYNFQKKFSVPLHSFGIGRQIPEDMEPATKERVVDLLFKLSKVRKDKVS